MGTYVGETCSCVVSTTGTHGPLFLSKDDGDGETCICIHVVKQCITCDNQSLHFVLGPSSECSRWPLGHLDPELDTWIQIQEHLDPDPETQTLSDLETQTAFSEQKTRSSTYRKASRPASWRSSLAAEVRGHAALSSQAGQRPATAAASRRPSSPAPSMPLHLGSIRPGGAPGTA